MEIQTFNLKEMAEKVDKYGDAYLFELTENMSPETTIWIHGEVEEINLKTFVLITHRLANIVGLIYLEDNKHKHAKIIWDAEE